MKQVNYAILILLALLLSCGTQNNISEDELTTEEVTEPSVLDNASGEENTARSSIEEVRSDDHSIKLTFEEFVLFIDSFEVWDEEGNLDKLQRDIVRVYPELGESIEGRTFKIIQRKEGELKIYQRFENSITVMNEGPHCDLIEWKHYNSEWKELKIKNGQFNAVSYSDKDWEKFIDVDMNEVREAVKSHCGEDWAKLIKDVNSPTEYPCGVSRSRIFLKVIYRNPKNGTSKESMVSFEIPMGC